MEAAMSYTSTLHRKYGSFFFECTKFAVSPYTNTFQAIYDESKKNGGGVLENIGVAALATGILTFVVPILPVIASLTFSWASMAMMLAVCSMFLTYPCAMLADAYVSPNRELDTVPAFA
jgi:hypothetical protein